MKKILIISPHFPPSNLAAVHRSRLFARHLPAFGWEPVILTVHEKFYEEAPDWNLVKLLPEGLRIEKVSAFPVTRPRLVGDIGIRAFFQLYRKARRLIKTEKFDFLYIPIPSFYAALLGRWLHGSTGISYGIDYIDPWVHHFPGSDKTFSRHWWSSKIATLLEPVAVKKASLITGVAEGYYQGVRDRNPHLEGICLFGAMPYGGEPLDHRKLRELDLQPYLFEKESGSLDLVYAGAFLPRAVEPLKAIFQSIRENPEPFRNTRFHFVGTGKPGKGDERYGIRKIAEQYGLWGTIVREYPDRIPYLDVLIHLQSADGVFVLGSTEPHYTPSKVYQGVLSDKPVLAVLHRLSSANEVLQESGAGLVLPFDGEKDLESIRAGFAPLFEIWKSFCAAFKPEQVNQNAFNAYSAENTTGQLVKLLDQAI